MNKRIEWLDIAKGIGILSVILSHCLNIGEKPFQLIFTFHMPLFLLLSGYVFSGKDRFRNLIQKKAKTLLLPFFGYYLLGLGVTLLLPEWQHGLTWTGIKNDLWLADPNAVHNSSIWYLVGLFFVVLLFYFIHKLPAYLQLLSLLVCWSFGIWYSIARTPFMGYNRLPLNLDVVPVAVVFFAIGYYARRSNITKSLSIHWLMEFAAFSFGALGVYVVHGYNGYVNLHGLNFGRSELYLAGGLYGALSVVGLSMLIVRCSKGVFKWLRSIFVWYGLHSLTILGLQSLLIRLYIVVMARYFDVKLTLYVFPIKHSLICFALVSFVVCPVICIFVDSIKKYLINSMKERC